MKKTILFFILLFSLGGYAQNDVTFNVDMNCYDSTFTTVFVTGPFVNWCGDCNPLEDTDGDNIWTGTYSFPTGLLEYKYEVDNWVDQEDLVDDMVAGGTCAPVTDFFSYANRQVPVDGATTTADVFGQCAECVVGSGCTNPEAINYDASANMDDGSCLFNVSFNIDMNCYDSTFTTVYVTGPFGSWCGDCYPLSDVDMDGIWTGDYPFLAGDYEYKYELDNWNVQENLVDDMIDGGMCAPITDFDTYANRLISVNGSVITSDVYDTCLPCSEESILGCTNPEAINYDPLANEDDFTCMFDVYFNVDMNCDSTDFNTVYVTGPFNNWCGDCDPLSDDDFDGVWTLNYISNEGTLEYKYAVDNFASQEDLIDDMVAGGNCAPITDFSTFANRSVVVEGIVNLFDTYGSCVACNATTGCTDAEAVNYSPTATEDDGSCLYNVNFSVDMSCDSVSFTTVYVTGPFTSWCGDCFPLTDADSDNVWEGVYPFPLGPLEYKYEVDNFAFQEELVDDMIAGGDCAPVTDFDSYANRLDTIEGPTTLVDFYGTCTDCNTSGVANDDLCDATEILVNAPAIMADNTDATVDGLQASCWSDTMVEGDVWFQFMAPEGGDVIIETFDIGGSDDTQIAIYSSDNETCEGALSEVACNDDISSTDYMSYVEIPGLNPGEVYYIQVDGWQGVTGVYEISVTTPLTICPAPSAVICDNFDDYATGPMDGQGGHWNTWSGTLGGAEDGIVSTEQAFSNSKSMLIAEGSTQDVILLLGNQTSGQWNISWMEFIPDSATAYYNIQEDETPAVAWNMEVFFNQDGGAPGIGVVLGSAETFVYPQGEWFEVSQSIDLETDLLTLTIDGVEVFNDFPYPGSIGSINFFSTDATNRYYIDDLIFDGAPVSVEELSANEFSIYPNPSEGMFNISSERNLEQIIVTDILGKVVLNERSNANGISQIDLSEFTSGVYMLTLFSEGKSVSKKIILK